MRYLLKTDDDLWVRLKIYCARRRMTVKDAIIQAILALIGDEK
jgi:hypothetical protein